MSCNRGASKDDEDFRQCLVLAEQTRATPRSDQGSRSGFPVTESRRGSRPPGQLRAEYASRNPNLRSLLSSYEKWSRLY